VGHDDSAEFLRWAKQDLAAPWLGTPEQVKMVYEQAKKLGLQPTQWPVETKDDVAKMLLRPEFLR
jgi:hypothetical protein